MQAILKFMITYLKSKISSETFKAIMIELLQEGAKRTDSKLDDSAVEIIIAIESGDKIKQINAVRRVAERLDINLKNILR